jgi:hypothetical protein
MTPKEKAKKLVLRFAFKGAQHEGEAKTFALIAVDEILNEYWSHDIKRRDWWKEVQKEIQII